MPFEGISREEVERIFKAHRDEAMKLGWPALKFNDAARKLFHQLVKVFFDEELQPAMWAWVAKEVLRSAKFDASLQPAKKKIEQPRKRYKVRSVQRQ